MPRFSWHSLERMRQYGITQEAVVKVIRDGKPFRYFHGGSWKTGYHDPAAAILVATEKNEVVTVIANVSYIERLKGSKP